MMAQIQRLPSDVAAQIKASSNLSSLNDVVIGLLENALDAESKNIHIKVDFARASCWIQDDGSGIHPGNFEETGGLCRPFHTSAGSNGTGHLGSNGLFLSSVAAVAVLNITSRYRGFDDANALILHFSRPATRLLPAPEHMALELGEHGSKISVHDLFGNIAVRVKQRPASEDDRGARDKEWNNLCAAITGCILAHGKSLHITMKGGDANHVFNVNTIQTVSRQLALSTETSLKLHLAKTILQQAFHLLISPSWIPISARTNSMVVQAIIGAEPNPQRYLQFICVGNRYLPPWGSCEMVYESVNQVFRNSSFGRVGDESLDHDETKGRLRGSRQVFKHRPMFVILVKYGKLDNTHGAYGQDFTAKLSGIVTALATRFLTEHHHHPRKSTRTRIVTEGQDPPLSATISIRNTSAPTTFNTQGALQKPFLTTDDAFSELGFELNFPVDQPKDPVAIHKDDSAFRSQFVFSRTGGILAKRANYTTPTASNETDVHKTPVDGQGMSIDRTDGSRQDGIEVRLGLDHPKNADCQIRASQPVDSKNEYVNWIDPKTRQTFCINVRTGFIVKSGDSQRPTTVNDSLSQSALSRTKQIALPRLLRSADGIAPPKDDSWAKKFFQNWHNPVFENAQARIPTAVPDSTCFDKLAVCGDTCDATTDESGDLIIQATLRLSKASLRDAVAIAQVDSKFILIRVPDPQAEPPSNIIVLVDQHAADERIGVEKLLQGLCSPPSQNVLDYASPLNQKSAIDTIILEQAIPLQVQNQERELFEKAASYFAQWGILYDIKPYENSQRSCQLAVLSLPTSIVQRCKLEPMLLLNLLRSEAWKQAEESFDNTNRVHNTAGGGGGIANWVTRIRGCSSSILDLINSRACRSAIMFNDVLTIDQCRKLVVDLAECYFPFQCAHGRPSMVPLLNLGGDGEVVGTSNQESKFADAWRRWNE